MMMCSANQKIYQHDAKISSVMGDFNMTTSVSKVDRSVLLTIPNTRYADKTHQYPHLQGVFMNDENKKPELPIHLILGASEYSRIKTDTKPRIGKAGEPVAKLTSLGWTMMSAGKEAHMGSIYLRLLASVYDPLGLASPVSLVGKLLHVTNISHGTRKYPRRSRTSGRDLRGAFQTKFKSYAVWQALRELLKRSIYTCSETQVGPERQLP